MKKILKWSGTIFAALVGLLVIALTVIYIQTESRLNRARVALSIPTGDAAVTCGRHIFQFRGCEACHGEQLEGKVYLDDPALGQVIAGNLTRGEGGFGVSFSDVDWVAAIRYGLRPDGTPLLYPNGNETRQAGGPQVHAVEFVQVYDRR
jgi:mono/diheme cytochrome c family protein